MKHRDRNRRATRKEETRERQPKKREKYERGEGYFVPLSTT